MFSFNTRGFLIASLIAFFMVLPASPSFGQAREDRESNLSRFGVDSLWGVGIKAGLNGVGLEIVKSLNNRVNMRLGYSWLAVPYSGAQIYEGYNLQVNARVRLGGANLLVDFDVYKNLLHLTGGLVLNRTRVNVDVSSNSNLPYGDISIPAGEVGTISAQLAPSNRISPYLALGLGKTLSRNRKFSFCFELGTFYQGPMQIELSGEGVIGPLASEHNTEVINKAIRQYRWYPILNTQLTYRIL